METINERIDNLIRESGRKQTEVARCIGIADASLSQIRKAKTNPSKQTIKSICREFGVSEEWLTTGEGRKDAPIERAQEIARIINQALTREPEEDRQKLIHAIQGMDDAHIVLLAQILDDLYGNK